MLADLPVLFNGEFGREGDRPQEEAGTMRTITTRVWISVVCAAVALCSAPGWGEAIEMTDGRTIDGTFKEVRAVSVVLRFRLCDIAA